MRKNKMPTKTELKQIYKKSKIVKHCLDCLNHESTWTIINPSHISEEEKEREYILDGEDIICGNCGEPLADYSNEVEYVSTFVYLMNKKNYWESEKDYNYNI